MLVSWNGSGFDLPVLTYRALRHDVQAPRYWETGDEEQGFRCNNYLGRFHWRHIDLMDVLSGYQGRGRVGLDKMAQLLGLPGKLGMSGEAVWDAWLEGARRRYPQLLRDRRHQHLPDLPALRAAARATHPRGARARMRSGARLARRRATSRTWPSIRDAWPASVSDASAVCPRPRRRGSSISTHDGRGVARIDGKTVFVADALPGERVDRCAGSARHRNIDEAELVQVLEPCADRVVPRCPHFGVCGGCALQHLSPRAQLDFKQAQLLENLARIGGVAPRGSAAAARRTRRGGTDVVLGSVSSTSRRRGGCSSASASASAPYVADLHECRVLEAPGGGLIDPLAALVQSLSIADRLPQIEVAVAENAMRAGAARTGRACRRATSSDSRAFERERGVRLYLQPGGVETVTPLTSASRSSLYYCLPEFDLGSSSGPRISSRSTPRSTRGWSGVRSSCSTRSRRTEVLDLYCGLGNFSLAAARRAARVVGVEGDAGLVGRAGAQCRIEQNRERASSTPPISTADCADRPWARRRYDRVLIDPPRAGASEILPVVARSDARCVVYISCHAGSLARDAGILVREHGFTLVSAGVMDMFPHTTHVEAMAVFVRHFT